MVTGFKGCRGTKIEGLTGEGVSVRLNQHCPAGDEDEVVSNEACARKIHMNLDST